MDAIARATGTLLVSLLLAGCHSQSSSAVPSQDASAAPTGQGTETGTKKTISKQRAQAIARELAEREGYDPAVYRVVSIEREGDEYLVFFEHAPPTPPGGHFGVYVNVDTGAARLMPGE